MIVMPANSTGWFHALARETGNLGHLYSPGAKRGPFPWFPYALDNGCFSLWAPQTNWFNEEAWERSGEAKWLGLVNWARSNNQEPIWAIVPDRPGDWDATCRKWERYAKLPELAGIRLAVAVQNGATVEVVRALDPQPRVICVGGSTDWKWETAEMWADAFKWTHLLRCNSPARLYDLDKWGFRSCDGTGWNRGDLTQTRGLEEFVRRNPNPYTEPIWPYAVTGQRAKGSCQGSIFEDVA